MGGKHEKRRHPDLLYLAGIILTVILFTGCTIPDRALQKQPDDILLQRLLTEFESQIKQKTFQEAAETNKDVLKILRSQTPGKIYSKAMLIQQAREVKVLINQILAEQVLKKTLTEQLHKNKKRLKLKAQSSQSMKTIIKNLNLTIQRLEHENTRLEKQIERMKQIDLK